MFSIVVGLLLAFMVVYPSEATTAAARGVAVWATAVLPALLPYMVCCQLLAGSDALTRLGALAERPMRRLFRCPGEAAPLLLLGMLGGSPSGARMIAVGHSEGKLSPGEAERLACLCGTVSPMFLLGTLPAWMDVPSAGWLLLGAHWVGALIASLLVFAGAGKNRVPPSQPRNTKTPPASPKRTALGEAISSSALAMLTVGGCIVLGSVAAEAALILLPHASPVLAASIHALLEMAGGCADLAALGLPLPVALGGLAAAVSFGGCSILAQNLAFLSPLGVRSGALLQARLLHAGISALLVFLCVPMINFSAATTAQIVPPPSAAIGLLVCAAPAALWLLAHMLPRAKSHR